MRISIAAVAPRLETEGLRDWSIGDLPRTVESVQGGNPVKGYPALVDAGDSVAVRVLGTETEQRQAMAAGTRRLLTLGRAPSIKAIAGRLTNAERLALSNTPYRDMAALLADCLDCAVDDLVAAHGGPVWDAEAFARLREQVRAELDTALMDVVKTVAAIAGTANDVERRLRSTTSLTLVPALTDIRAQLTALIYPGFISPTGRRRLPDVLRYLRAMERRLERLPANPDRDRERMAKVQALQQTYGVALARRPPNQPISDELAGVRWMLEELRVSFFAQGLGTPYPVSEQRISRALGQR
jgi:ATP-dependent helicase HrpA